MIMMVMIFDQNLLQKIITYHNDHENPCAHFYNEKPFDTWTGEHG